MGRGLNSKGPSARTMVNWMTVPLLKLPCLQFHLLLPVRTHLLGTLWWTFTDYSFPFGPVFASWTGLDIQPLLFIRCPWFHLPKLPLPPWLHLKYATCPSGTSSDSPQVLVLLSSHCIKHSLPHSSPILLSLGGTSEAVHSCWANTSFKQFVFLSCIFYWWLDIWSHKQHF